MDRRSIASTVSPRTGQEGAPRKLAGATRTPPDEDRRTQPAPNEPSLRLAPMRRRNHTLILNGELDGRSAHTLEAEIERLCKEDVTSITLDLRDLTHVDSIGMAMLAFRSRHCKRLGYEFAVISGSRQTHRACREAGIADLTELDEDDGAAPSSDRRGARVPLQRRLRAVIGGVWDLDWRGASGREGVG